MSPVRWCVVPFMVVCCGCMAASSPPEPNAGSGATAAPAVSSPLGNPFAERTGSMAAPLVLDRTDLRLGTTVHLTRIPTVGELHDLSLLPALIHVVLTLPEWPNEYASLQVLDNVPPESDLIVILPGYPPSREAAQAWNLVRSRLRMVLVVSGPPPSAAVVGDLNSLRGLERVIAQMDEPSRSGFERLQRPLSFRKIVE